MGRALRASIAQVVQLCPLLAQQEGMAAELDWKILDALVRVP